MTHGEEEADADGPLALLHQLAGYVVDRGDVVGIDGVPKTEAAGEPSRVQKDRMMPKYDQRPGPDGEIGDDQEAIDADQWQTKALRSFVEDRFQKVGIVYSSPGSPRPVASVARRWQVSWVTARRFWSDLPKP